MPFFDFKCEKCGHEFNVRVSSEEKSKVKCEKCEHPRVVQLLSPFFSQGGKSSPSSRNSGFSGNCGGCSHVGSG